MKELNFEQMAQVEGGGTECPGGHASQLTIAQMFDLTIDTFYGVTIMRNSDGQVVCDD